MKLEMFVEEWKDTIKKGGKTYEIFVNPTPKEIRDCKDADNRVRFIIDVLFKNVYVFNTSIIHQHVAKHFKFPYTHPEPTKNYVYGQGFIVMKKKSIISVPGPDFITIHADDRKKVRNDPKIKKYFVGI